MNGFLLINKPKNITSHDVVKKLRKKWPQFKIGHTGSLDPFATGLVVVGVNEALKVLQYLHEEPKIYQATLKLGIATDTLDCDGKIILEKEIPKLTHDLIQKIFDSLIGTSLQIPPMYSAKKIGGKKLYQFARSGVEIERKPISISIFNLKCEEFKSDEIRFLVSSSKGTYIRALGETIAHQLKTAGHLTQLRRIASGDFKIEESFELEDSNMKFIPIEKALSHHIQIPVLETEKNNLFKGQTISLKQNVEDNKPVVLTYNNEFIGMGLVCSKKIQPKRMVSTSTLVSKN